MKENLLGQKYVTDDEVELLTLALKNKKLLDILDSNRELSYFFKNMSESEMSDLLNMPDLSNLILELTLKRDSLQSEIEELFSKKDLLQSEIQELQEIKKTNEELKKQNASLDELIKSKSDNMEERLELEISGYRIKRRQEVESELENELSRLKRDIEVLTTIKEQMQQKIYSQINQCINNRNAQNGRKYFVFEPVKEDNELYNQNHWTIDNYYEKLIHEYSIMTGLEYEEAKIEFVALSGALSKLVELLEKDFNNEQICYTESITNIISYNGWNDNGKRSVHNLMCILNGIYLPNYQKMYYGDKKITNSKSTYLVLSAENAILQMENEYLKSQIVSILSKHQSEDEHQIKLTQHKSEA